VVTDNDVMMSARKIAALAGLENPNDDYALLTWGRAWFATWVKCRWLWKFSPQVFCAYIKYKYLRIIPHFLRQLVSDYNPTT
jgi:hypothetical protein